MSSLGMVNCVQHANGRDWWMLQHKEGNLLSFLIDPLGIRELVSEELPFKIDSMAGGSVKFNKAGDKFGILQLAEQLDSQGMELIIGDFDRCAGRLSNLKKYNLPSFDSFIADGLEFSASGNYMYIGNLINIYQLDLKAPDIINSMIKIMEWDSTYSVIPGIDTLMGSDIPNLYGFMQRGPDGKIYIAGSTQTHFIHMIHNPDEPGLACNPENRAIRLPTFHYGTLPTFPTLRLGPLDGSACDTLGIDNRPVAKFRYEQDGLDTLMIDFVDLSFYEPTLLEWDFGDGTESLERFPTHRYGQPGTYEVCLTVSNAFSSDVSCDSLFLGMTTAVGNLTQRNISLFPNPAVDQVRISFHDYLPLEPRLLVYDLGGKLVMDYKLMGRATNVDVWGLESGVYVYEVWDGNIILKQDKFIKIGSH